MTWGIRNHTDGTAEQTVPMGLYVLARQSVWQVLWQHSPRRQITMSRVLRDLMYV